jgi:RimJ/RimL family protein N-acetyltransferase
MSETEFAVYSDRDIIRFAEENVKAGYWHPDEALDKSREAHQRIVPDVIKTKNHFFFKIEDAKQDCWVGTIWLYADFSAAQPTGFIYDIFIEEPYWHKRYGKQAMLALEGKSRELGLNHLALHVFAHNLSARALYEALGYQVKSMNMTKAF